MSENVREFKPTVDEVKGLEPGFRFDYRAKSTIEAGCEYSLVTSPAFKHLSVLPPPTVTKLVPTELTLGVPRMPWETASSRWNRPSYLEIRKAVVEYLLENCGFFINGMPIGVGGYVNDRPTKSGN